MLKENNASKHEVRRLVFIGLFAALSYIGFQFFRIDVQVGMQKTAFHLGNTFLLVAALLLGPVNGALAGSLGMTLADLTSGYMIYAPQTFFLKMCIGLITGILAHKFGHLHERKEKKEVILWAFLSTACGMVFNVVADPVVGYLYQRYLLGTSPSAAGILAKMAAATTSINAVIAIFLSILIYLGLLPIRNQVIDRRGKNREEKAQ